MGILLLAVAVLEALHRERFFAFAMLLASMGFAASICLYNVDDAIVRYNVNRTTEGKLLNAPYLATLSYDAIPALAEEFQNQALSNQIHEGIGAALVCQQNSYSMANQSQDWRSFNLSYWRAFTALDSLSGQLDHYRVSREKGTLYIRTPGDVSYECTSGEPTTQD